MYVDSLSLRNIKAFGNLNLVFSRPGEPHQYAGFNVFVGGNASGKSTLLKCIAMAVSGPVIANQQLVTPSGWIRNGENRGAIELRLYWDQQADSFKAKGGTLNSRTFDVGLVFEASDPESTTSLKDRYYEDEKRTKVRTAERGPWNPEASGWFIGAYGPLRRLTGSSSEAIRYSMTKGRLASCVTLFREDAALTESETWIKQEHARGLERSPQLRLSEPLVDQVQKFLNDGLLPGGFKISRITVDHVYMTSPNGSELPMRDLSDGFRSTYALMLDIIHNMAVTYGTANLFETDAEGRIVVRKPGVILIDELEAHLHPAWQRTICEWLKTRFPRVQFFVATHSPLIVQGADQGGIFVLPLPHELSSGRAVRRLNEDEHERVVLGRAERVLLGEAFGLKQTWSVRAEKLVHQWELLEARREAEQQLTPEETAAYNHLSEQMKLVFDDEAEAEGDA